MLKVRLPYCCRKLPKACLCLSEVAALGGTPGVITAQLEPFLVRDSISAMAESLSVRLLLLMDLAHGYASLKRKLSRDLFPGSLHRGGHLLSWLLQFSLVLMERR